MYGSSAAGHCLHTHMMVSVCVGLDDMIVAVVLHTYTHISSLLSSPSYIYTEVAMLVCK